MSDYTVARIDEIDELSDGRCPFRPVRMHFGIMSFGVNTWTGKSAGDRIINEHDEADEHEELYLVQQGRATFELDGERVDAPAGTMVFARPGVKRTAFAEDAGTTIVAIGGTPGEVYEPFRLRGLAAAQPALRGRQVRRGGGSRPRADRAESRVLRPALQRRVLREPGRADGRCDRAPAARDRAIGAVPLVRRRGLGLRSDPRGAGVQGAGGLAGLDGRSQRRNACAVTSSGRRKAPTCPAPGRWTLRASGMRAAMVSCM